MILKSKYNIGDKVYHIRNSLKTTYTTCKHCIGTGGILDHLNKTHRCSVCDGIGNIRRNKRGIFVLEKVLTIGQIRCKAEKKKWKSDNNVEYMCEETGIGSGSLYKEKDLFVTKKEAEEECFRRQEEKKEIE